LQVIDGKVRLVSELMCDGLGACIGHCPEGAITIETREAEPYNEIKVLEQMAGKGKNTIIAHFRHLKEHGETGFLQDGVKWLSENKSKLPFSSEEIMQEVHNHGKTDSGPSKTHTHIQGSEGGGCPGSRAMVIGEMEYASNSSTSYNQPSELRQWPVQMHLINHNAPYFRGSDLLLAADCVAFSMGNFHSKFLKGKTLAIACPKLDHGSDVYVEKITALVDIAMLNTITVMMMEVPCCGGLLQIVKTAMAKATRKVPVKMMIIGLQGNVLKEEWV